MAEINKIEIDGVSYDIMSNAHASADTTYGIGDTTNYGHLKLEEWDNLSSKQQSDSDTTWLSDYNGTAGSFKDIYFLYRNKLNSTHASLVATTSIFGHTKIIDSNETFSTMQAQRIQEQNGSTKAIVPTIGMLDKVASSFNMDITAIGSPSTTGDELGTSEFTDSGQYYTGTYYFKKWIDLIYPIGSIYMNISNSANPSTLFPGTTWEQIEDTFLLAAGSTYTAGSTGGEAEHTLTTAEMPTHRHSFAMDNSTGGYIAKDGRPRAVVNGYSTTAAVGKNGVFTDRTSTTYKGDVLQQVGGGNAHNNMPPYLTVYTWKRTA